MSRQRNATLIGLLLVMGLSACSDKGLRQLRNPGDGPDEFRVLPVKPLSPPESYTALPTPTPGGTNLVDPNPNADAVVALGGSERALNSTAIPSSDGALVTATRRYGVPGDIRQTLAQEDADFRRRQGRLSGVRLFPVDRYSQAYRREALDPFDETERFRNYGIGTVSSPPPEG